MSDTARFEQLIVRRGAGIAPPGFELDELSEGINVVYGHNAAGKTTVARAIQTLLWPEDAELPGGDLTGLLHIGQKRWRIDFDRGRTVFQRDGADVEHGPPAVPPEHRDRYYLGLDELLATGGDDFAAFIARESTGGYDVEAAGERLGFRVGALRVRKATRQVREAENAWRDARDNQKQLHQRARQLDELNRRIERTRRVSQFIEALQLAIECRNADDRCERIDAKLEEFPDALETMAGTEHETLCALRERLEEAESELEDATRILEDCRQRLDDNPLGANGIDEAAVSTLSEYVSQFEQLKRRLDSLNDQFADATARRDRARRRIAPVVDVDDPPEVDAADVEQFTTLADNTAGVEAKLDAFETLESLLGDPDTDGDAQQLRRGIDLLARWVAQPGEANGIQRATAPAVVAGSCAVLLAVGAPATGLFVDPLGWLLLAVAVALVWPTRTLWNPPPADSDTTSRRPGYRRDFERLDLPEPEGWTEQQVRRHLEELVDRWAQLTVEQRKRHLWDHYDSKHQRLQTRRRSLEQRRNELSEELAVELPDDPARTGWLLAQLDRWQRAGDDAEGLGRQLDEANNRRDQLLERINQLFADAGFDEVSDLAEAKGRLDALRRALRNFENTRTELQAARETRADARRRRRQVQSEIDELFERLDIDERDAGKVEELCTIKDAYEERKEEYIAIQQQVRDAKQKLRRYCRHHRSAATQPGNSRAGSDSQQLVFDADELLDSTPEALKTRREKLQKEASKLDDLRGRRDRLEARIEVAKEGCDVERHRARLEARREELRGERRRDFRRAVGEALVDYVCDQTREANRPPVFRRARRLFARITRGRYRLQLEETDAGSVFRAFDTNQDRGFALEELSSGTRVQLLLAVRIAFVECREQTAKLPVVLDETLANSDDTRARAIVRAVEQIGADGRQIFYFTAQADEVDKWRQFTQSNRIDCNVIALDDRLGAPRRSPRIGVGETLDELQTVEPPDGADHHSYGQQLGVGGPVELWMPVTDLHLWYVVEDPEKLYRLLAAGIERWGQLHELQRQHGLDAVELSERAFARIEAGAGAMEAFLEARRTGRGRPVDRRVLEESGAVSDTFIDRVAELCEEVGGDAAKLVADLYDGQVKRFRTRKTEQLEEYLRSEDFLTDKEPLEPDEIWLQVLAASSSAIADGLLDEQQLRRLVLRGDRKVEEFRPESVS